LSAVVGFAAAPRRLAWAAAPGGRATEDLAVSWQPCDAPELRAGPCDPIDRVLVPRERDLGGFSVRRLLPAPERRAIGPFVFLDQMGPAELAAGRQAVLRAPRGARVLLLGGDRLDGPRHLWWNFVSSRLERIEQAKADWRDRRFAAVPGETGFMPLPEP
jgi:hypothetical protein